MTNYGQSISAAYYNSIQSTVAGVLGTGGYYQTLASSQLVTGSSVYAADWTKLQTDINKCQQHQSGAAFIDAQLPTVIAGTPIGSTNTNLYETQAGVIATNRLTAAVANMTLVTNAMSIQRASTWGGGNTAITGEFQADWGTAAQMAKFFNTGSELRWNISHANTTTPQDSSWNTLLASLGPFDIHGGTVLTSTGSTVKFPLNSLTATYQTIFSKTSTVTSYTANTVLIQAKLNAAGTGVVLNVVLTDGHTNGFYDSVASGTLLTSGYLRSTVIMTGVNAPTYTILTPF